MITLLILTPLVGALFTMLALPNSARGIALGFNTLSALVVFLLWQNFDASAAGLQLAERHAWIPAIGAEYLVGIDGLSLLLVILTSIVFPFALLAQRISRGAAALMLVMQAALYGTFTAQNFVLWFLFYEMSLIPAFLLIKIWGGENRDRAATKFFLYTFLGSVAMLLAFLGIYFAKGTFDFAELAALGKTGLLTGNLAWWAFAGIFLGLAVKVPLFPFHTWLPDAYETAPDRRLDGADRRAFENGRLRFRAPAPSAFPERNQNPRSVAARIGRLLDRLSLARRVGAIRSETDGRVSFDQPSRLLHARPLRAERRIDIVPDRHACGAERRLYADLQPRHRRGRAVLFRRFARATARSARHRRFRRTDAAHAVALRLDERRHVFVARSCPGSTDSSANFSSSKARSPSRLRSPPSPRSVFSSPPSFSCARCKRSSAVHSRKVATPLPILRGTKNSSSFPSRFSCSPSASRRSSCSTSSTPPSFRWRDCSQLTLDDCLDHLHHVCGRGHAALDAAPFCALDRADNNRGGIRDISPRIISNADCRSCELQDDRARPVGADARDGIPSRRRWHQPDARSRHQPDRGERGAFFVGRRPSAERIFLLAAARGRRLVWRLSQRRSLPPLRLLRARDRAEIFPHRDLGIDQQGVRRDEADALFLLRRRARLHRNHRRLRDGRLAQSS